MSPLPPEVRGMYFEEFEEGQKIKSMGRTVTESDIVNFSGLSGDYNSIHNDEEYSKSTMMGKRMAHGILGLSIASGLAVQTGVMEDTIIAFREISNWKFIKPIFIGDTIHVVLNVLATKAMPRLESGLVTIELDVINQDKTTVMKGTWKVLIKNEDAKDQ